MDVTSDVLLMEHTILHDILVTATKNFIAVTRDRDVSKLCFCGLGEAFLHCDIMTLFMNC